MTTMRVARPTYMYALDDFFFLFFCLAALERAGDEDTASAGLVEKMLIETFSYPSP